MQTDSNKPRRRDYGVPDKTDEQYMRELCQLLARGASAILIARAEKAKAAEQATSKPETN